MERYVYDRPYAALHRVTPPPPSSGRLSSSQSARLPSYAHSVHNTSTTNENMLAEADDLLVVDEEGEEEVGSLRSAATSSAGPSSSSLNANNNNNNNITVVVRVRPPLPRELAASYGASCGFRNIVDVGPSHTYTDASPDSPSPPHTMLTLCEAGEFDLSDEAGPAYYNDSGTVLARQSFGYDEVYGPEATQRVVYERTARPAVDAVLEGYNATLIAYGQTGTGKTYTMEGFVSEASTRHLRRSRGIIPRAVEDIFAVLQARQQACPQERFLVRASYAQIYNEVLSDLLATNNSNTTSEESYNNVMSGSNKPLAVRHSPRRGVYIDGLSEWVVTGAEEVYALMRRGAGLRATASTRLSELSSRSHAIFTVVVETLQGAHGGTRQPTPTVEGAEAVGGEAGRYRVGKLHIVDLAGSEKVRQAGVSGQRLEETKKINKSLHELGNVIAALASMSHGRRKAVHVPFRNSVLTSALRDSLGGNCRTTLIACVSPSAEAYSETLSTLLFASRARCVRTHAVVNERSGAEASAASLLRRYEKELEALRHQLADLQTNNTTNNAGEGAPREMNAALSTATAQYQRAEEDRKAALQALEQTSAAHAEERRRRQALERRVHQLEAILDANAITPCRPSLTSSQATGNDDAERSSGAEQVTLMMDMSSPQLAAQREDTTQMTRYKQLLLKQRDMMLSLTARLQERDEVILRLEDELDGYDAELEQKERQIHDLQQQQQHKEEGSARAVPTGTTAEAALCGNEQALARLREALQTRAAQIAREQYARHAVALQNEAYVLQLRATLAEEQCRVLQAIASSSSASRADIASMMAESRRAQQAALQEMAAEMAAQGDARRALAHEVDKLQLGLSQLRLRRGRRGDHELHSGDEEDDDDADRLWQALQIIEEGLQPPMTDSALCTSDVVVEELRRVQTAMAAQEETWQQRFAQLQQDGYRQPRLDPHLSNSSSSSNNNMNSSGGSGKNDNGRDGEGTANSMTVRLLRQQLLVHEKDRQALQLIMEQRIRPKAERICELLQLLLLHGEQAGSEEGSAATQAALAQEANSLRTLVTAAIRAMSAD